MQPEEEEEKKEPCLMRRWRLRLSVKKADGKKIGKS
jgi:hypothetical protein